uniref:Reverse transcriptase domain-containing protein n=1 Tax=Tanacetum cinerariifolium TaxID=118510 RepID=A0A6L2J3X3_TANCI|nr:hypothetical protein [Tanacetum cinerariifolium]
MCFNKALADLGASVSVMPYSTYTTLGLGDLIPTKLIVELANRTVKRLKRIAKNMLIGIDKFIFLVDFIILDIPEDFKTPLILGRPFLSTAHAVVNLFKAKITLSVRNDKIFFKSNKPTSNIIKRVYALSLIKSTELDLETRLMGDELRKNKLQDPNIEDFIELNDPNEPIKHRRNQVKVFVPTIDEGQPCDGYHDSCTCPQCEIILLNGICINCTYGDGKPITCYVCDGPLRGGFCLFCDSKAENSFTCNPNAYSFNDTSRNFNHFPQPRNRATIKTIMIINKELAEYINSSSWNRPTFFSYDEEHSVQYKEYLANFSNFDIRQLIREECGIEVCEKQKQNMEDTVLELLEVCRQKEFYCMYNDVDDLIESALNSKLLSINLRSQQEVKNVVEQPTECGTQSDEVIDFSAKNLLPIPSEYEATSDDESECHVPIENESSPVFTIFSNPLFDDNDDFTSSNDESLYDKDIPMEDFKVYLNPLFDDEEIKFSGALMPTSIVNEERIRREHEEYISLIEKIVILKREEIDILTGTDELLPLGIKSEDYDSEGEIHVLEELLVNNSIPFPKNESSNFDHQDNPSFPRPPLKPQDVEFFFDLEPELISAVMNNVDELNEDECFNLGGEINVFANVKDDDYFPFIFVIRIFLLYLVYPEVSPLLLSVGSEDTIFNPGISF